MKGELFAYRLAPWRRQLGRVINITVIAFILAAVIMVYLSISEKMAKAKLNIQMLEWDRNAMTQQIADLTTEEGKYTAFEVMKARADKAGYVDINFYDENLYDYIIVDGYTGTGINSVRPEKKVEQFGDTFIRPEYTQSLQQWLAQKIAVGIQSYESDN